MQQNLIQEEKDNNLLSILLTYLLKGMCFCFKFCVYLIVEFLQMIINFIYALFDFDNWGFLNHRNRIKEERLLEIEVPENSSKHEYIIKRSDKYDQMYDEIGGLLKVDSNQQKIIDNIIADDILKKIDTIVVQSEKNALQQGYKFARETKYILPDGEIYESYIKSRIMKGE